MNVKNIITSQLDALKLGKFANLAPEIKAVIDPAAEKIIRKMVSSALKKVIRQTVRTTMKPQQKENTHENQQ
jgi:hypothetical protein